MKKILSLILAMLMLVSMVGLVACEEMDEEEKTQAIEQLAGKSPEQIYDATLEQLNSMTNFRMEGTVVIAMNVMGYEMTEEAITIVERNGRDTYFKMTGTNSGSEIPSTEVTLVGDDFYMIAEGIKAKVEMTPEQFDRYLAKCLPDGADASDAILEIPRDWFSDIKFTPEGDAYYLAFNISGEKYTEYFGKLGDADLSAMNVSNIDYRVYFDAQGNLEKITQSYTLSMEYPGYGTITAPTTATYTVSKVGEVQITVPAGGDTWQSIDAELLLSQLGA